MTRLVEPKLPQCRVDLARAGDGPLRSQRPGLVRRDIGLGRVTQAAQEDVVEVLFNLGLVQLLQDPLFQVFRPFPEGGMCACSRRLASICLLRAIC